MQINLQNKRFTVYFRHNGAVSDVDGLQTETLISMIKAAWVHHRFGRESSLYSLMTQNMEKAYVLIALVIMNQRMFDGVVCYLHLKELS